MKNVKRRYVVGVSVALVAAIVASGAAFAYWTSNGTGAGTAAADTGVSNVTVVQTSTLNPMFPGDTPQTLSGNFDNPGPNAVFIVSVTAHIDSVTLAADAPAGTCDATDFVLANATAPVGAEVAVGAGVGAWSGPTIHFNDKTTVNQDACKGATVNLTYTIP